jgi:hypothetical protein
MIPFDLQKSKEKKRLIISEPLLAKILGISVITIIPFLFTYITFYSFTSEFRYKTLSSKIFSGLIFLLSSIVAYFIISNSIKSFRLIQYDGLNSDRNRKCITEILKGLENFKIDCNNQSYISAYASHFGFTRELYVIFDNRKILANCTTMARYGLPSPFHYWKDRGTERRIIKLLSKNLLSPYN